MKFRRKSNHLDSPSAPELFPNIDFTTLCQVWHHGMLVRSLVCTKSQDGGVDEADEALFMRMPLHPPADCPAGCISGTDSVNKLRLRLTKEKEIIQKHRNKKNTKKGKQKFIYASQIKLLYLLLKMQLP
jgi:hypothetical protein